MIRNVLFLFMYAFALSAKMIYEIPPKDFLPKFEIATCYIVHDDKILYLKRTHSTTWPNTWGLPGGSVDSNETPMDAAIREVFEETGMDISNEKITPLKMVYVRDPKKDFYYHMFQCTLSHIPNSLVLADDEHTDYIWISPKEALNGLSLIPGEDETLLLFINHNEKLLMSMQTKEQYLIKLKGIPIEELWIRFLKIQSDLFFDKEFASLFNEMWWSEARDVLEIGSGNGDLLAKLKDAFPDKNYIGLETESASIARSRKNFQSDHLTFFEGDAEIYNEELSERFDVIIFRLTLQHLKQPRIALEHAFRYLKKGGHVFIVDSHDSSRKSSYPTPLLNKAAQDLNEQNRKQSKGNRQITLEIQRELKKQGSSLWPYFSVCFSNLDEKGIDVPNFQQIIVHSLETGSLYRDYYLLFLQILNKGWGISIDFEKAYDEVAHFVEDRSAWQRSGKHILLLEKKE